MSHYESVADEYESAFFYGDIEYRDWLLSHLVTLFRIEADSERDSIWLTFEVEQATSHKL